MSAAKLGQTLVPAAMSDAWAHAGEVNIKVPKLRRQTFETAIIERYRRRESSVWPAPGSEDTKFRVTMGPEAGHGEAEVYAGV
jgi:Transposase, Mutator family